MDEVQYALSGRAVLEKVGVLAHFRHVVLVSVDSVTRVTGVGLLDLIQNLTEVVVFRSLQRRELFVRLQVLQPQLLADGMFQSYRKPVAGPPSAPLRPNAVF